MQTRNPLPLDEWSTIVVQKRRRRAYIYVNGERADRIRMRRALPATESDLSIGAGYEGEVDQIRISGGQMQEPEMEETVIVYDYNARNQLVRRVEEEESNGNRPWWARLAGRTYTFYAYDRNGNMRVERSLGGKTESKYHTYDKLNRMTRTVSIKGSLWAFWRRPEITTEAHEYAGAEWRRVANAVNGERTTFVYDGDNVVVDKKGGEATLQYVTPFLDQNLTMTVLDGEQQGTYYYSQDGLGSVRTLTDSTGTVVNRYDYTAFGSPHHTTASQEAVRQRYTYTGRESTTDPALMYYRYRMYAPGVGRFVQRDPIGFDRSASLYPYAFLRPSAGSDPYGLEFTGDTTPQVMAPHAWVEDIMGAPVYDALGYTDLESNEYPSYSCEPCGKGHNDDCMKLVIEGYLFIDVHSQALNKNHHLSERFERKYPGFYDLIIRHEQERIDTYRTYHNDLAAVLRKAKAVKGKCLQCCPERANALNATNRVAIRKMLYQQALISAKDDFYVGKNSKIRWQNWMRAMNYREKLEHAQQEQSDEQTLLELCLVFG